MEIKASFLEEINQNTLYRTIGIRILEAGDGRARSRLEPDERICWPFPGQPHGGIISTLMDTTMAWAVFSQLDRGYNCATISLDIQYTRPARGGVFFGSARVTHRSGHLSFVACEIHDTNGKLIAMGQATFRVIESDVM